MKVASAVKLDNVELGVAFMRIMVASDGRRDRIAAMPRDANPIEDPPGACAVSLRAW